MRQLLIRLSPVRVLARARFVEAVGVLLALLTGLAVLLGLYPWPYP